MRGASFSLSLILASQSFALSFAIVGDAGKNNANTTGVRNSILKTSVRALVIPGDNIYNPQKTYGEIWDDWKKAGFSWDVVAIGNHTLGYDKEVKFFGMPGEFYSKTYGHEARFIVLNSDNPLRADIQIEWLNRELALANEAFVFLVYHHPSFTVTQHHSWLEKESFQRGVRPLLWKYRNKITGLLIGHDHMAEMLQFNDLPAVLAGASWECREDRHPDGKQEGVNVKTGWMYDGTPHWVRLDLDSKTNMATVNFVRTKDDKSQCTVHLVTGQAAKMEENCRKTSAPTRE